MADIGSSHRVLDYSHYVEIVDQEECACASTFPTGVTEHADTLGVPSGPLRFVEGDLGPQLVEYWHERLELFGHSASKEQCPHCVIPLATVHEDHRRLNSVFGRIFVKACPRCGWWESSDECTLEENSDGWYRSREVRRRALLREYSVGGSEIPLELLHDHIVKRPELLRHANPRRLEELVGKAFSEVMQCEAIHLGGPNDNGIDLILVDGERQYCVQVKRRSGLDSVEAVQGIREFVGAMLLEGFVSGMFVTTAPRFSVRAKGLAKQAQARKLVERIELVDFSRLVDVCHLTIGPDRPPPWKKFAATRTDPPFQANDAWFAFPTGRT